NLTKLPLHIGVAIGIEGDLGGVAAGIDIGSFYGNEHGLAYLVGITHDGIRRSVIVPRRSSQKRRAGTVEKTAAEPPWKTLRVSYFPTASTAAVLNLEVLCSKPKTW